MDLCSVEFPLGWLSRIFAVSFQNSLPSSDRLGSTAVPHDGFSPSSFCKYPHPSGTPLACSFHPSLFLMRLLVAALFHLHGNAQETNITSSCMRTSRACFTGRACRGTTVGMAFCRTALVAPFYGFFFPGNVYQLNQKHNLDFILATAPSSPSKILQCRAKANLIVQGLTSWKSRNS